MTTRNIYCDIFMQRYDSIIKFLAYLRNGKRATGTAVFSVFVCFPAIVNIVSVNVQLLIPVGLFLIAGSHSENSFSYGSSQCY